MVDPIHVNKTRIASLDLIKFIAICGVLIIHLIGKTAFGGIFWYAQAVPLFMVLMGYHCNNHINWKSLGKAYISYLILFFVSLALALYVGVPFSVHYFPIGLIPFQGPGTYWILLYFLFVFISPFLYKLRQSVSLSMFILILFLLGWSFDVVYELLSDNLVG